jgi:hypothetical protein
VTGRDLDLSEERMVTSSRYNWELGVEEELRNTSYR